jgi:hypothetical protein
MTNQEIESRIESLYKDEKSKGFYFHLINSFKQKKLKQLSELNEKSICAITGEKITTIDDAIASEKSNRILSKQAYISLQIFSKKVNNNAKNPSEPMKKIANAYVNFFNKKLKEQIDVIMPLTEKPREAFKKETLKKEKVANKNKKFTSTIKLGDLQSLQKLKEIYEQRGE